MALQSIDTAGEVDQRPAEASSIVAIVPPDRGTRRVLIGIFILLSIACLYFAGDFLLPVALAILLTLVFRPIVRVLHRWGVPEFAAGLLVVLGLIAAMAAGIYYLSAPITRWVADAPTIARSIQDKIATIRGPVDAIVQATDQVEQLTENEDPSVQRVVLSEPGLLSRAATGAPEILAGIGLMLVLMLFLLGSGTMFYEKLVRVLPTLSDKKMAVRIVRDIEHEVSRYLFTVLIINLGLGAAIALGLYLIGMPTPLLWGFAAGLLNFIPYLGALVGVVMVSAVGLVSFDTLGQAALAPLVYIIANAIEGQIVTPLVVGKRLELNEVAIFIAVAFWGWLWGLVGALVAVPFLVLFKVLADHVDSLRPIGEFLSARHSSALDDNERSSAGELPRHGL